MGVFSGIGPVGDYFESGSVLGQICQQLNMLRKVKSCFVAQSVGNGTLHLMK